ncbi:uncharacterized protein MYCFIDRAFT_160748 [Pseudocercospora fijiensis CIRAD86]|uniref:NAD(P)-binding domain-containing protein n=1 Tax=Pseudocercospora fijiensis (strain CIRAD86) TaxID=383855 RepID=N1QD07_PSEFD|nr:uncharacterized protein MYCFIDRAFT_160748 [Pseudocercospora fijiensis CIRAD86]EME89553.1 hypothetical protein MYCFIDRAFT_160748 [Pseudocercospora fijiensis CIRAD86]
MPSQTLDLLILGAGWTSTFLIPLLKSQNLTFAATTRDGRNKTLKWSFDPINPSFTSLPKAHNILITFPLTGTSQSKILVSGYTSHHKTSPSSHLFIQLGSTGIYQIPQPSHWTSRSSNYDKTNARAIAEDEILSLNHCVLNLSGLWGGDRDPRTWVSRVAKTKAEVKGKKSVHLIHGVDVARGIVATMGKWEKAKGQRFLVTDGVVYDWWELFVGWAEGREEGEGPSEQAEWVYELMWEEGVRALPRSMDALGRCYDSREFWRTFGLVPLKARITYRK